MKVIYSNRCNGLSGACTGVLLAELIKQRPEYFIITKVNPQYYPWGGNDEESRFGSHKINDISYIINTSDQDIQRKIRTDPIVIELFDKHGKNEHIVVDIPNDVEWEVWTGDHGEESIHEKHRYWN